MVKDGEVVERGPHDELVHAGGVYTALYETQYTKHGQETDKEIINETTLWEP